MVKFGFNEYFILKPANIVSSHDGELTENLIEKAHDGFPSGRVVHMQ